MIDVVFLLLVYFMAATEFLPAEEVYPMDLPQRQATVDPFALDDEPVRISVSSRDALRYTIQIEGPYPQPDSFEALRDVFATRLVSPQNRAGLFRSDHPMYIAPVGDARWDHVLGAYNAIVQAGYEQVVLLPPS